MSRTGSRARAGTPYSGHIVADDWKHTPVAVSQQLAEPAGAAGQVAAHSPSVVHVVGHWPGHVPSADA